MTNLTVKSLLLTLLAMASFAQAFVDQPPLPQIDAYKVIQLSGEEIPQAVGLGISDISVAAVIDDVLEPIPFQVDEYNEGGALYFESWDVPIDGTKGLFDDADKVLFLFKDAGPRKEKQHFVDGSVLAEVVLKGKDGVPRYAYIVKGSKLRSEEQYVRYSAELAHVETDFYSLTYDKENHLKWLDFTARDYLGEPPLDSMKLRLNTGLVTSVAQVSLDNDQFVAVPTGEIIGPIRSASQQVVTLWFVGLPLLKISLQMHHYPQNILYDVRVIVPSGRRKLMAEPSLSMSVEGNKLLGAFMRSELGPVEGGIVDGMIDENEQTMIESGIDKDRNWIWVTTQRNLDLAAFFNYLGDANEPVALHLMDSMDNLDPPERFPGQLPNMGYKILNFPDSGFFGFVVSIFLSKGYVGNPSVFMPDLRTPPEMQINSIQ